MKWILALALVAMPALAEEKKSTLRGILLGELRAAHNVKEWYVPANTAVEGLTPEQAAWRDGSGNHSVGQLANHLVFWNGRQLARFKGEPQAKYDGNNDETFNSFDAKSWAMTVKQLDEVLTAWEKAVETMDDARLDKWAPVIAHIATHNAYHVGQIIYLRKLHGVWDPEKGVKG
jgi:uncharacterized damage-inducible protein DinB